MDDFLMHEHSDEWNKQARREEQWEEYQKWTRDMDGDTDQGGEWVDLGGGVKHLRKSS
jgi:hypothetical protein